MLHDTIFKTPVKSFLTKIPKKYLKLLPGLLFFLLFFALLYKIYIPRINAFGCFDDCFNFMGGYFLKLDFTIYRDFYFNHQPGMAIISFFIQSISNPKSIAELILYHRQFILIFSFIASIFLFLRFGYKIIFLSVFYELIKFYIFGDRFLAEAVIGYLAVYQIGSILDARNRPIFKPDIFIMPIISWMVFYLREPFAPFALVCLLLFSIQLRNKKQFIKIFGFFAALLLITFLFLTPSDYLFNVYTVNNHVFSNEFGSYNIEKILQIFFSPIYELLAQGPWSILRLYIALISIAFIFCISYLFIKVKEYKLLLSLILILGLTNIRPAPVGMQFFEAFHSIVWVMSLTFIVLYLLNNLVHKNIKLTIFVTLIMLTNLILLIGNKHYFAYEKIDTNEEFFTNYSYVMDIGTTIRNLSDSDDTLFVDGYDDLILWESHLRSPYKYVWYTSFMNRFDKYTKAREKMFTTNPPDFYYGDCMENFRKRTGNLDKLIINNYIQITDNKSRGCVLINNRKIREIKEEQWNKINRNKYFERIETPI